jgi:hypothetical protein
MIQVPQTPACLEDMGMTVSFESKRLEGITFGSPQVRYEDSLAGTATAFLGYSLKYKCLDGMQHHRTHPGKLATLVTTDPVKQTAAFQDLVSSWEDFEAGKPKPGRRMRAMIKNSPWQRAYMKMIGKMIDMLPAALCQRLLHEIMLDWFANVAQCKIQEEYNRQCRMVEQKSAQSKNIGDARRASIGRGQKIWKRFKRREIKISCNKKPPAKVPTDFFRMAQEHIDSERIDFGTIAKRATWPIFTPMSINVIGGEAEALAAFRRINDYQGAGNMWQVDLIPEHELVRKINTTVVFYVMSVQHETAFLGWPMHVDGAASTVTWGSPTVLEWTLVVNFEEWVVLPSASAAPIGMYARGMIPKDGTGGSAGLRLTQGSQEKPVLKFQQDQAFKGVPASTLKHLREETLDVPDTLYKVSRGETAGVLGSDDAEVMVILTHLEPTIKHADLKERLKERHSTADAEDVGAVKKACDDDILTNLMLHQDYIITKDWVKAQLKVNAQVEEQMTKIPARVNKFLHRAEPVLGDRRPKLTAAQRKKEEEDPPPKAFKADARWRADIEKGDASILLVLRPGRSAVYWDVTNGAWKVMYRGKRLVPGSFSCHEMGRGTAMKAALNRLWEACRSLDMG